jgi:hypothetical protein
MPCVVSCLCGNAFPDAIIGSQFEENVGPRLRAKKTALEDLEELLSTWAVKKARKKIPGALRHNSLHKLRDEGVLYSYYCWCARAIFTVLCYR